MPTNFLNRRMDLKHTYDSTTDYLTMDTSYPVKLAGKVIKIFNATDVYHPVRTWSILNSEKEEIMTTTSMCCYDFAGRIIDNEIGEGKAYPTAEDVWKEYDYVMVIIDFDNKTLHLCSQTNFEKFITGGGNDCTFKLFDITATEESSVKIKFNGEERYINQEQFREAVAFENEEGCKAFIRDDNDKEVIYQLPKISKESGTDIEEVICVPVSDIKIEDINHLNCSNFPIVYPNINTGYRESFEIINGLRNLASISGTVTNDFIKDFCYTADELTALKIVTYKDGKIGGSDCGISGYGTYYIQPIFDKGKQNEYVYFITQTISNKNDCPNFKTSERNHYQAIFPISLKTNKFMTINDVAGNVNRCAGHSFELNFLNNYEIAGSLISNWWNGLFDGSWMYWYTDNSSDYTYAGFNKSINDSSTYYRVYSLSKAVSNNIFSLIDNGGTTPIGRLNFISYRNIDFSTSKYFSFFSNKDTKYLEYLKKFALSSNHTVGIMSYANSKTVYDVSNAPSSVVFACQEHLFNYINDESITPKSSMIDYCKEKYPDNINPYSYVSEINENSVDSNENRMLVFKSLFYSTADINKSDNNLNLLNHYDSKQPIAVRNAGNDKFRLETSQSFLLDSNNNNTGLYIEVTKNDEGDIVSRHYRTVHFMSKMITRSIDSGYGSNEDKQITEVIGTRVSVVSPYINFVKARRCQDYSIKFDTDRNLYITSLKDSSYVKALYIYNSKSTDTIKMVQASYDIIRQEILVSKTLYLYFIDDADNYTKRIRLVVDCSTLEEKWKETTDQSYNPFTDYDYFTDPISIISLNMTNITDNFYGYDRAWCSLGHTKQERIDLRKASDYTEESPKYITHLELSNIILSAVIENFNIYGKYVLNPSNLEVTHITNDDGTITTIKIPKFGYKTSVDYSYNISNVTHDLDNYEMSYYRLHQDLLMIDMIPEYASMYTGLGVAPKLSTNLDSNGSFIYDTKSYNDFINTAHITEKVSNVVSNITSKEGGNVGALLNPVSLKYINSKGVREEYYNGRTISEFFTYMNIYDIGKPMNEQDPSKKIGGFNFVIYPKGAFDSVSQVKNEGDKSHFADDNGNIVFVSSAAYVINEIPNNNRYGFNKSYIYNAAGTSEINAKYTISDKIYASEELSGNKVAMNISLVDENGIILNINGILGKLNVDELNWDTLLVALSNNKTIDILSSSLKEIKNSINDSFIQNAENVSDKVSVDDNVEPSEDEATFLPEYNIYKYKQFAGYDSDNKRDIKNRGVIVFVTQDGYTQLSKHGSEESSKWTEDLTESKIHAKRMYISQEGIICTKDYYDKSIKEPVPEYGDETTTVAELYNRVIELESKYSELQFKHFGALKGLVEVVGGLKDNTKTIASFLTGKYTSTSDKTTLANIEMSIQNIAERLDEVNVALGEGIVGP